MPKLKTHSGAKKRFKLTKNGKDKTRACLQIPYSEQKIHQAQKKPAQSRLCGSDQHEGNQVADGESLINIWMED